MISLVLRDRAIDALFPAPKPQGSVFGSPDTHAIRTSGAKGNF